MRVLSSIAALLCMASLCFAQAGDNKIRLSFSDTDASKILSAIGLQTGANIVYNVREKITVTLTIAVDTTEEAVRNVTAAAGLAYKRFDKTFIIAKPEELRKAVLPFTGKVEFTVTNIDPVEAAKRVEDNFSAATARGYANVVVVQVIPADVRPVGNYLAELDKTAIKQSSAIIPIRFANPAQVAPVLTMLYPSVKTTTMGDGAENSTRSIALSGPKSQVDEAIRAIEQLDVAPEGDKATWIFDMYEAKYSSPVVLKDFLASAMPDLKVTVGPEVYTPMQPILRTLTSSSLGGSNTSSSGGSSGSSNSSGQSGGQVGSGTGSTSQPFQRVKEGDRAKHLLLHGTKDLIEKGRALLDQFDLKPKQVKIEVRVVDVSPEKLSELGFDFEWSRLRFIESRPGTALNNFPSTSRPAGLGEWSRVPWTIDALLNALVTTTEAKILARPSIQVIDNDDATFFVGNTIRVRLSSQNSLGGATVQVDEFPIGIILTLRPRVNVDGNITLRIHPVVSSLTELNEDGIPQSTTREAESTVIIKSGETVVVGGLIQEDMRRTVREIPILGQLPILGELFKTRSSSARRSEVMVFISPKLVEDNPPSAKVEEPAKAKP